MLVQLRERLLIALLLGCIAMSLLGSLSTEFMPDTINSQDNIAVIVQAKMALQEGQFPIRIAPVVDQGWRYPFFQFAGPTSFTIAGLIHQWLTPSHPFSAYKITLWLALLVSGIYFFRLTNWFFKSPAVALLTSAVYMTAPYYSIVINHLTEFNEAIALGIIPMVLYYTFQRFYFPESTKALLLMALAWYLLITVHVFTFVYTLFFVGILLLCAVIKKPAVYSRVLSTVLGIVFGSLLALWYLVPLVAFHKNLNIINFTTSLNETIFRPMLSNLLSPIYHITTAVMQNGEMIGGLNQVHPNLGFPLLFAAIISLYTFFMRVRVDHELPDFWFGPLLCTFIVAFVLLWSPLDIWQKFFNHFSLGVYNWRLLGQLAWTGSLLFAWSLCWYFQNKLNVKQAVIGLFLILLSTSSWLNVPERNQVTVDEAKIMEKPVIVANESFLMNVKTNVQKINFIDQFSLNMAGKEHRLELDKTYPLMPALMKGKQPALIVEGIWPKELNAQAVSAYADDKLLVATKVKSGDFTWQIPLLTDAKTIKFVAANHKKYHIDIKDIFATGLQDPASVVSVDAVKNNCQQRGAVTVCKINTGATAKLVELPIMFYPGLLRVKVNGKTVSYLSVLYQNYLIAAVRADAGDNTIRVEFRGIDWANYCSRLSWGLWLFGIGIVATQQIRKIKNRAKSSG